MWFLFVQILIGKYFCKAELWSCLLTIKKKKVYIWGKEGGYKILSNQIKAVHNVRIINLHWIIKLPSHYHINTISFFVYEITFNMRILKKLVRWNCSSCLLSWFEMKIRVPLSYCVTLNYKLKRISLWCYIQMTSSLTQSYKEDFQIGWLLKTEQLLNFRFYFLLFGLFQK